MFDTNLFCAAIPKNKSPSSDGGGLLKCNENCDFVAF